MLPPVHEAPEWVRPAYERQLLKARKEGSAPHCGAKDPGLCPAWRRRRDHRHSRGDPGVMQGRHETMCNSPDYPLERQMRPSRARKMICSNGEEETRLGARVEASKRREWVASDTSPGDAG